MKRLDIRYVDHLPPLPEDLPPELVQVYIGASGDKVDLCILRHGFIVADCAMDAIARRIDHLNRTTSRRGKSVAESVGLYPHVSPDWREFFANLLQQDDSWAFLVPVNGALALS
jgi:hypothetical protein